MVTPLTPTRSPPLSPRISPRSARTSSSDDEDAPPAHDSAPFGDAEIVEDLGTSAADLLAMCAHEGTLPMDVLVAVCEKAGCGEIFDDLRA